MHARRVVARFLSTDRCHPREADEAADRQHAVALKAGGWAKPPIDHTCKRVIISDKTPGLAARLTPAAPEFAMPQFFPPACLWIIVAAPPTFALGTDLPRHASGEHRLSARADIGLDAAEHADPSAGDGWLEPWHHDHRRARAHLFGLEPAFIDRALFVDFSRVDTEEGHEFDLEVELELPISRRVGLVVEAPYAYLSSGGEIYHGLGDIALAPRLVLVEHERWIASASVELSLPTGDADAGLGTSEAGAGLSLLSWLDLGGNAALHGQLGIEHGLRSDADTLVWGLGLTYSFGTNTHTPSDDHKHEHAYDHASHAATNWVHLIAELRGEHPLDGDDRGSGTGEWTLGLAIPVLSNTELRGAITLPAWEPTELNHAITLGIVRHF